ncbi:energy transducer TonB [Deferribacter autotrophicus]|uniref:energy transducer TonB n=1 Tax=Deferribacter autotrophicus TaxID=500465 RepID=UPI00165D8872|nr:energy transducer TonB [Deferribacter autotrophicus]
MKIKKEKNIRNRTKISTKQHEHFTENIKKKSDNGLIVNKNTILEKKVTKVIDLKQKIVKKDSDENDINVKNGVERKVKGIKQIKRIAQFEYVKTIDPKIISIYRERVIRLISDKIEYPYIARKRGYEGYFLFQLSIDRDGNLVSYEVLKKDGKEILKKAAIKTLKAVRYPSHEYDKIEIKVPVLFKLVD